MTLKNSVRTRYPHDSFQYYISIYVLVSLVASYLQDFGLNSFIHISSFMLSKCLAHLILPDLITILMSGDDYKLWISGPNFSVEWLASCPVFLKYRVQILAWIPSILTKILRGCSQSLQANTNTGIVP